MTRDRSPESRERQKERIRLSGAARSAAERRLKEAHPDEWHRYYNEEAEAVGVSTIGPRSNAPARKIAKLRAEIAELEGVSQ